MIITRQRIRGATKPFVLAVNTFLFAICALLVLASPVARSSTAQSLTEQNMELQGLLAPIALYPDTVLNQVLTASTRPLEVVQAQRWLEQNNTLTADDAVMAASLEGWHPSVVALVAFPDILQQMSFDLAWTEALGYAVLQNQARVLEQVQFLRQRAYLAGTVQQMDNIRFRSEQRVWIVEPVITQRVYIPYYDTSWVYGSWWWRTPPRNWYHRHRKGYRTATHFYWGAQVTFGSTQISLWTPVWREGRLNWGPKHHHHVHKRPPSPRYRVVQPSRGEYWVDRDKHDRNSRNYNQNHNQNHNQHHNDNRNHSHNHRDRVTHVPNPIKREATNRFGGSSERSDRLDRSKQHERERHDRKERKWNEHADSGRNRHYSSNNRSQKRDTHEAKRAKREYLSDRNQKRVAQDRLIHPRGEHRSPGR